MLMFNKENHQKIKIEKKALSQSSKIKKANA